MITRYDQNRKNDSVWYMSYTKRQREREIIHGSVSLDLNNFGNAKATIAT